VISDSLILSFLLLYPRVTRIQGLSYKYKFISVSDSTDEGVDRFEFTVGDLDSLVIALSGHYLC